MTLYVAPVIYSLIVIAAAGIAAVSCVITLIVLAERRRSHRSTGPCGDHRPSLVPIPASYARPVTCTLPEGHATQWHRGRDGSEWTELGGFRPARRTA